MRAADTNVLVRLATRDDAKQVAAAESFVAKGAWISHLVLVEALWVLESVYGLARNKIAATVEVLLSHRELVLQDPELVALALDRFRASAAVTFSDCLILETARRAGHLPLGTFDRRLAALDGAQRVV